MKLKQVDFENFKSIKEDSLIITHNCMILVGKNEAGKSNVLKGVAGGLSAKAYPLSAKYKRKRTSSEKNLDFLIDSIFQLDTNEVEHFAKQISSIVKGNFLTVNGKNISNKDFIIKYYQCGIYRYNIGTGTRSGTCYLIEDKISLTEPLIKLTVPFENFQVGNIVAKASVPTTVTGTEVSLDMLNKIFTDYLTQHITSHIPAVYYWRNDPKHLLPATVTLSAFQSNPNSEPALKTLFSLAGYNDIAAACNDAIKEDGDLFNLLTNVGEKATIEFQKKWPDLRGTSFVLIKDSDTLSIKIEEKAKYNIEERSDGFKHFISILLSLSSQVELKAINNAIIIIDEPDQSLYPTAAKYLRDELIKLSKNNIVIYATHSPFMIDDKIHSRHVIVKKENEITTIAPVTDEDESYQKDDVLLTAMGTSRFEFIKENNVIFEGWSDYNFFKVALKSNKKEYKDIKSFFKTIGITFVHGVSSIRNLTPILQLANRNVFVVSDADEAAQKARTSYVQDNGYQYQHWFTFKDLGIDDKVTIEDFIIGEDLFQNVLVEMGKEPVDFSQRSKKGVLGCVANVLKNKEEKQYFKNMLAEKLASDKIDPSYYELLEALKNKIENATENR